MVNACEATFGLGILTAIIGDVVLAAGAANIPSPSGVTPIEEAGLGLAVTGMGAVLILLPILSPCSIQTSEGNE